MLEEISCKMSNIYDASARSVSRNCDELLNGIEGDDDLKSASSCRYIVKREPASRMIVVEPCEISFRVKKVVTKWSMFFCPCEEERVRNC